MIFQGFLLMNGQGLLFLIHQELAGSGSQASKEVSEFHFIFDVDYPADIPFKICTHIIPIEGLKRLSDVYPKPKQRKADGGNRKGSSKMKQRHMTTAMP